MRGRMSITNCTIVFATPTETDVWTPNGGGGDEYRNLTETGQRQALELRAKIARRNHIFNQVITSVAHRAVQTADIIIGAQHIDKDEIGGLYSLPNPQDIQKWNEMLAELGKAPLKTYFEHLHAGLFSKFATQALIEIEEIIGENVDEQKILIVADPIPLIITLLHMFPPGHMEVVGFALHAELGEGELIEVHINQNPHSITITPGHHWPS